MNSNKFTFGRFSTPLEDYMQDLRKVATLTDLKAMETKYSQILDDAAEAFAAMTEESFQDFIVKLPKCFGKGEPPDEDWLHRFGAIILPKLFIELAPALKQYGAGSGLIMHRLLDVNQAEIKNGKFQLIGEENESA